MWVPSFSLVFPRLFCCYELSSTQFKNMTKDQYNRKNGLNADLRSIDSIYRMIVVAGLRSKQLVRGATPKILPDPDCRRNISIALEEARRGLIHYTVRKKADVPAVLVKPTSPYEVKESVA